MTRHAFLPVVLVAWVASVAASAERLPREHVEFFEKKVRPVLVQHCYECHAKDAKKVKGGLLLDSKQGWMRGGDTGPAIVPGDPDESLLISAIRHIDLEMPPKQSLAASQIEDLVQWVKMGAPDPRDEVTAELIKREINIEEGRQYWAFQPPQRHDAPPVKNAAWPAGDIDRFVLAKLEAKGIAPVADADPAVLIRRLYFDLIGLPPSPEEVDAWVRRLTAPHREARVANVNSATSVNADALPDGARLNKQALEQLVDKLLASPQFGERWGRHWLDVARYAESAGMERNVTFPAAWRYRDYVIEAVNDDKPYDQFVREQIAGDLLPGTDENNRDERIIATGFLAMGPKSLNERNRNVFVMDVVDEQIDVATRAVMGVTVSCARCHDHKFDPFPQQDYYALAGIFRSCQTYFGAAGGQGNRQPSSLIALGQAKQDAEAPVEQVDSKQDQVAALTAQLKKARAKLNDADKNTEQRLQQEVRQLNKQLKQLQAAKKNNKKNGGGAKLPAGPAAMGLAEGDVADCRVHIRGDVENLGDAVPRGFLQVVALTDPLQVSDKQSGRLELAQWMSAGDNPLTARVMANRTWHWLFGQGIVRTVDNFGTMGERPANQELLDHLATRFVDEGWSVKKLVREIVLSHTYRLASSHDEANFQKDPENLLCWRQNHRRLDAESIRDAVLAASGQLDLQPAVSSPVAKLAGASVGGQTDDVQQIDRDGFRHRSVYLPILRNALPEVLSVFDFAEPSIIVGRRQVTTVPSQALFMMNSDFVVKQSDALAARLVQLDKMDLAQRIEYAYRLTLCRGPSADEIVTTQQFMEQFQNGDAKPQAALSAVCQALLASAEFRYIE